MRSTTRSLAALALMLAMGCSKTHDISQVSKLHAKCMSDSDCDDGIACVHYSDMFGDHAVCDILCPEHDECWQGMYCGGAVFNLQLYDTGMPPFPHCLMPGERADGKPPK